MIHVFRRHLLRVHSVAGTLLVGKPWSPPEKDVIHGKARRCAHMSKHMNRILSEGEQYGEGNKLRRYPSST